MTVTVDGICNSRKSVRGLHKIALSLLAQHAGMKHALSVRYDPVRRFVMKGKGERMVLMFPAGDRDYRNEVWTSDGSVFPVEVVGCRLVAMGFMVDLSPSQEHLPAMKKMCRNHCGSSWTWVPIRDE